MAYLGLFSAFYTLGNLPIYSQDKRRSNGFLVVGSLGTISLLLTLSFNSFWERRENAENLFGLEFMAALITCLVALTLAGWQLKKKNHTGIILIQFAFLIFIPLYILGNYIPFISQSLINILILTISISLIKSGTKENHLGLINYGILVITALIICRFFDSEITFVIRGLLFIAVGAGFFAANYFILKKRKQK